jgi:hypothetical protein
VTPKSLVTGMAAVALVAAAAGGVTSIASSVSPAAPVVTPVVWDVPMPQAPAPELQAPLTQTLNGLVAPGSYSYKQAYIQGGLGRIETRVADRKYADAAAKGYFPVTFAVADIDSDGTAVTANVTATTALGTTASQPITFVPGPSPSGYQISKESALAIMSSMGG